MYVGRSLSPLPLASFRYGAVHDWLFDGGIWNEPSEKEGKEEKEKERGIQINRAAVADENLRA